jgi:hypothetical protein
MLLTSMLLVTSLLPTAAAATAPEPPACVRAVFADDAQTYGPGSAAHSPHQFGIGGALGASIGRVSRVGGSMRYWFSERVGLEMNASWVHNGFSTPSENFVYAMPSLLVTLTPVKSIGRVDLRPYAGGGPNLVHASGPAGEVVGTGGMGMQAFGGVEVTFKDANQLAISVETRYTHAPVTAINLRNGTYSLIEVHYYLR